MFRSGNSSCRYPVLILLFILAILPCCRKNEDRMDSDLLRGNWQFYEGFTDGEPLIFGEPEDPALRVRFYAIDSVHFLGMKGKYAVKESERKVLMTFTDTMQILEVLKLDREELWTLQTLNEVHMLELRFYRIN